MDIIQMNASVDNEYRKILAGILKHNQAINRLIDWFKEKRQDDSRNVPLGAVVIFNGGECLCTKVDVRVSPTFCCNITINPLTTVIDIGNGCGSSLTIDFMGDTNFSPITTEKK